MARDFQDIAREVVINALEKSRPDPSRNGGSSHHGLSGIKGIAAGAGAAALVPLAAKNLGGIAKRLGIDGVEQLTSSPGKALKGVTSDLGDSVGSSIGDKVTGKLDEAGGPSGILKDTVKDALPFGGGADSGGSKGGVAGVGKGRRMPVQQSIDIGIPIETVYNQWTQFSEWPTFMHRVTRVTQEDDCTVSFAAKIWGKTKEFTAEIETQRPNERIKWSVTQGMTHTGVVTFHELGPNLTRILLGLDVEPGGLMEKAARGMRHVKRAARADLHRFKAFIEMAEHETGAWRGVIEEGELVEEHDSAYDDEREYANVDDVVQGGEEEDDSDDERSEDEDDQPRARRGRAASRASSEGTGTRSRSASGARGAARGTSGSRSRAANSGSRSTRGRGSSPSSGSNSGSGSRRPRASSGKR